MADEIPSFPPRSDWIKNAAPWIFGSPICFERMSGVTRTDLSWLALYRIGCDGWNAMAVIAPV